MDNIQASNTENLSIIKRAKKYGQMQVTRVRYWTLGILFFIYLVGVLILSAVTLHEPKTVNRQLDRTQQYGRIKNYDFSIPGLRPNLKRSKIQWCTELKYINPPIEPVALVSFPGSGNTWLRYLVQQATGYYTGSIYHDYGLLKNGFPAEHITNGSVIMVKTHEWGPEPRKQFSKAVVLVRNPGAAIQAEFNRQSGGHIGFASPDRYKRAKGKYWQLFVADKLDSWKQTNLDWLYNFTGPTHIIFYEQLVDNVEHTLRSVLDFLEVPVDEALLKCALERREGIYKRKKRVLNFDPYTSEMKTQLEEVQRKVYEAINNFATPSR